MTPDLSKHIVITLSWGRVARQYEVKGITNTTAYKPGDWLDVASVDLLCKGQGWEVVILDDQIIQYLLGIATGVASKAISLPKV